MVETTDYPVRSWSYDGSRWTSREVFGSDVAIKIRGEPDFTEEDYKTFTFNELSVATTDWTLYIPVEENDVPMVDISNLSDIVFHIGFYHYTH